MGRIRGAGRLPALHLTERAMTSVGLGTTTPAEDLGDQRGEGEVPRVGVIFTGGSIDCVGTDRLDLAWYVETGRRLENHQLLERIPEIIRIAEVEEVPFRKLPSHALSDTDWLQLADVVSASLEDENMAGAVITHGTNNLEETAYFLHLVLNSNKPVVLTGSMRPPSGLSPDGDLNLLNAIRVAASPSARHRGVLVVLNDTMHSARDVTKGSTMRIDTFQDRELGPLGFADPDGKVVFYHDVVRRHTTRSDFALGHVDALPRVDVVLSYVGADEVMIDAAVSHGARGLVCAAYGAGYLSPAQEKAFEAARDAGVAVCIASRVGSGRVVRSPNIAKRGFIAAGNLLPWKARLLLSLALTRTKNTDDIQALFDAY